MTDKQDLIREIHEYVTTHGGENTATHLLVQAASAIQTQAVELEAIGAGGVSGPLIGQPQAMPDLTALTERGAKAWAGVDAQGLREGFTAADMATAAAQGFRDGVASVAASAESEPVAQLAAERDELFQAAIDFIRTLTGMEPPPIEVAPPEVFAPFHAFVNTVQAIINKRNSSPREGMVMVPKEPTHHMLNAAASAYKDARQSLGAYNAPWAAYRAMLEVAAPPAAQAEGWRPIETAPKDGALIVLGARNGVWLGKYVPVYQSGYRPENPWASVLLNHNHMAERYTRPTHWMPLPPPPTSAEGVEHG